VTCDTFIHQVSDSMSLKWIRCLLRAPHRQSLLMKNPNPPLVLRQRRIDDRINQNETSSTTEMQFREAPIVTSIAFSAIGHGIDYANSVAPHSATFLTALYKGGLAWKY